MPLQKLGDFEGAPDGHIDFLLRLLGSKSRQAVIDLIQPALAAFPEVTQAGALAAASAVADAILDRDLVEGDDPRLQFTRLIQGVSVAITAGDAYTFLTANDKDGGPTALAAKLIATSIGLTSRKLDGISVAITAGDAFTFLTADDKTGAPTPLAGPLMHSGIGDMTLRSSRTSTVISSFLENVSPP